MEKAKAEAKKTRLEKEELEKQLAELTNKTSLAQARLMDEKILKNLSGLGLPNGGKLMKYLNWLYSTTSKIKKFFICKNKKDTSIDIDYNVHKLLFKTSSYKFCNYKDSCKIHKNKNKICDKNHFVFDILLIDLQKLIESIELISKDDQNNLFWIIDDNIIIYDKINNIIEKHKFFNANILNENQMYIDKNLIFKCFDVISFIFNKMHDEAYLFLNYNISSELIII